jgi:hypothetical protein
MPSRKPPEILVIASLAQAARARGLCDRLRALGARAEPLFPGDDTPVSSIAEAATEARAAVLLADRELFGDALDAGRALAEALAPAADRLLVLHVEPCRLDEVALRSADKLPGSGTLAELAPSAQRALLERLVHEARAEADASFTPAPIDPFNEYRMLFDSTERLVDRRRESAQTYLTVNAAICAVIAFFMKDLALEGGRVAIIAAPLFIVGIMACQTWVRVIRQFEQLIDWRYRQLRRMERRRFQGGYRAFSREWDAIYAPRARRTFGFSSLEAMVPRVFQLFFAVGLLLALLQLLGLLPLLRR